MQLQVALILGFYCFAKGQNVTHSFTNSLEKTINKLAKYSSAQYSNAHAENSIIPLLSATTVRADVGTLDPIMIDTAARQKTCPPGYDEVGKQCSRTIYVQPEVMCLNGGTLTSEGTCIHYLAKNSQCLAGFTRIDSLCVRRRAAPKELRCPDNYLIRSDRSCVRTSVLNNKEVCPAGSQAKGDICVIDQTDEPTQVCPQGFTLSDDGCIIEETYDCTPQNLNNNDAENNFENNNNNEESVLIVTAETANETIFEEENPQNYDDSEPNHENLETQSVIHPKRGDIVVVDTNSAVVVSNEEIENPNIRKFGNKKLVKLPSNFTPISQADLSEMLFSGGYRFNRNTTAIDRSNVSQYRTFSPYISQEPTVERRSLSPVEVYQAPNVNEIRSSLTYKKLPATGITSAHAVSAVVRDYIAASVCKRIRMVPSEYICERGVLNGRVCRYDVQVPKISVPGGISESIMPPALVCQDGFSPDLTNDAICIVEDEMTPEFFCPTGTEEQGDRCVYISSSQTVCGPGFVLERGMCAQTQIAAPLVKYTVTFACEGKECEQ